MATKKAKVTKATKKEKVVKPDLNPEWKKQIEINGITLERTDDLLTRIGQLAVIVDQLHDRVVDLEDSNKRLRTRMGI